METRREHFEKLPEDVRAEAYKALEECPNRKALEVSVEAMLNDTTMPPKFMLSTAFSWAKSEQGSEYWRAIDAKYFSHE